MFGRIPLSSAKVPSVEKRRENGQNGEIRKSGVRGGRRYATANYCALLALFPFSPAPARLIPPSPFPSLPERQKRPLWKIEVLGFTYERLLRNKAGKNKIRGRRCFEYLRLDVPTVLANILAVQLKVESRWGNTHHSFIRGGSAPMSKPLPLRRNKLKLVAAGLLKSVYTVITRSKNTPKKSNS